MSGTSTYRPSNRQPYRPRQIITVQLGPGDKKALKAKAEVLQLNQRSGLVSVPKDELERIYRLHGQGNRIRTT